MARTDVHHHNATAEGALAGVGLALLLFGAILVTPGALLVFAVHRLLGLSLDRGQLWTFAGVTTTVLVGALAAATRDLGVGLRRHTLIALAVTALVLVARFGFHADWPRELWCAFTGLGS